MARLRERAFAGFFAGLFIVSSCALTIAVIYQMVQDNNKPSSQTQTLSKTQEAKLNQPKLQGTQLSGFTPVASIPELQKIDTQPGTGETVKPGETVTVDYTGAVANTGIIFQSSKDMGQPVPLSLKQVIAGWSQGIPGMKVGGTRRLLIPAALAYGNNPPQGSGIPGGADLVFDVTVVKIGQ